jgi:hypothetical protein
MSSDVMPVNAENSRMDRVEEGEAGVSMLVMGTILPRSSGSRMGISSRG